MGERVIIENDYGLTEEDLRIVIKNLDASQFSSLQNLCSSENINFSKLSSEIQKIKPTDQSQYLDLLKVTAVYFLSAKGGFEQRQKNDALWHVLQFEGSNLLETAKEMNIILSTNRNILHFSRKISVINRNGRLLGCLLVWDLSYRLLGEETNEETPQFHTFSDLIRILDVVDINLLPSNVNILHMVLECISFLLNAVVISPINTPEYSKYFEYNLADLSYLKEWTMKIIAKFPVSATFENDVDVNAKISELIDFIIKEYLSSVLKDNSISLINSQEISFNDSVLQ
ncbi:hypothetical protein ACFFRR_001405 [Megaselia abdita]